MLEAKRNQSQVKSLAKRSIDMTDTKQAEAPEEVKVLKFALKTVDEAITKRGGQLGHEPSMQVRAALRLALGLEPTPAARNLARRLLGIEEHLEDEPAAQPSLESLHED